MAISSWYIAKPQGGFGFPMIRGTFVDSPDTEDSLGEFLMSGLAHEEYGMDIVRKHGFDAAADYLANRAFADKVSTRIGDFGEIASGRLL